MMSAPQPYPTVGVNAPAPDDAQIEKKMPSICVDYLSHNWAQEDVWQSWKAMTKRKNEIANGVRLENASWRTWAKQRGNLKTINPETLNWLKDSDVTWLYGPLHEHADPVPPPKVASTQDRLDLDDSSAKKSILKHRTISEMLTTPGRTASPAVEIHMEDAFPSEGGITTPKTQLIAVKSDTNLAAKKRLTGGSPPASARLLGHPSLDRSDTATTGGSSSDEKRHISFNSRVDQCIAVDYAEDHGYDEYSDESDEEASVGSASSEEADMLTMKSSPRNNSQTSLSSRQSSPSSDHSTIAKLAPTMLKTSDAYPAPSPAVVDPTGFTSVSYGAGGPAQASVTSQKQVFDGDSDVQHSSWEEDGGVDYFNAPYVSDRGSAASNDAPQSILSATGGVTDQATRSSASANSTTSSATSVGSASNVNGSASQSGSAATAQPRSILKKRGAQPPVEPEPANDPVADATRLQSNLGAKSAFIAQNVGSTTENSAAPSSAALATSYDSSDSQSGECESGRGRSSQRLGSSASYERIQEAARKSSTGRNSASGSTSPSGSLDGASTGGKAASIIGGSQQSQHERERRGSFRGRDQDGHQRSGAAARLGIGSGYEGDGSTIDSRPSSSDDDTDSDFHSSSPSMNSTGGRFDKKQGTKARGQGREHQGSSMSPAGSQRLSVDLDNLPSNDPNSMGSGSSSGAGGPTPLNTPTLALARSRGSKGAAQRGARNSSEDGFEGAEEANAASAQSPYTSSPLSPVIPRRTSATGALVAPSGADRQAGVRVPLADDFVEEDEGGIIGRAVEIVNTARDLIAAVWPTGRGR